MATLPIATSIGWVVCPIIKLIFEKVQSYTSTQYKWQSDLEDDLKKIESTLIKIQLVLGAAERSQMLDCNQEALLCQMKDSAYDADDVMDEFDYLILKANAQQKSKLSSLASSSLAIGKRLVGQDKFRSKLRRVLNSLIRVKECADMLIKVIGAENSNSYMPPQPLQWRVTSSISPGQIIIGRQNEQDDLVHRLLREADGPEPSRGLTISPTPSIITIVGSGGIGKTALAQLIYNDRRIVSGFDLRTWIYVSNIFNKVKITKEILKSIDRNSDITNFSFNMLQEDLKNKLTAKKFLLVLDDVWYDEKIGAKGSKILVTARTNIVSRILGCPAPFHLEGLKGEDSWNLFRICAFGAEDPGNYPELESIGECIVQKLNGSALVIKVVGAHLNANLNVEEWTRVMKSSSSNKEDIMQILRLSYECLPGHLQQCFTFCSLFPKGYSLEPDLLELQYGHTIRHVMHDLMNDLASHISRGEYSRIERDGNLAEISGTTRHLSIPVERVNELHGFHNLQRLRTLIVSERRQVSLLKTLSAGGCF
uniref:NB-ARC domain-containing protein n=1 Tax=Oryza meridionalis TaxID=40149 RepID=A0A0E0C934_9ORYZ